MPTVVRRVVRGLWVAWHIARGLLLCALVVGPALRLAPTRGRPLRTRLVRWWMQRLLRRLGVCVSIRGTPAAIPALLVANHISWLDIPCLLGHVDTLFVAKADVAHWPLIGRLTTCSGTLFLERGAGAAGAALHMTSALQRGQRVMVFPEGTSTDGRGVRPFHARLFEAAVTAGCPVQAVAIRYPFADGVHPHVPFVNDDAFLPHLWRLLGERELTAEVTFFPPQPGMAPRRVLADTTRAQIDSALAAAVHPLSSAVQAQVTQPGQSAALRTAPETPAWNRTTRRTRIPGRDSSTTSTRH